MTSLILSLTEAPTGVALETRCIETDHYTLGRDAENDWVLADPARRISRHHCLISRQGDNWMLSDLSRNGVRHESGFGPAAGPSGSLRLVSGDRLHLGDYEITVTVQEDESSFRIMPLPDFVAALRHDFRTQAPPAAPPRSPALRRAPGATPAMRRLFSGPSEAAQREDPLLAMLGLGSVALPAARRSVILFRLGAALDSAMRGLRQMIARDATLGEDEKLSPLLRAAHGKHAALGWLAGTANLPDGTPALSAERLVEDAFDDLERHRLCVERAYQRCLRDMLDALDPDRVAETADEEERNTSLRRHSLSAARRRHRAVRAQFEQGFDDTFARAYAEEWRKLDPDRPRHASARPRSPRPK